MSGRFRHDVVALAALTVSAVIGLIDAGDVFAGFGHPAVVTVAAVLVLSGGLQATGAVQSITALVLPSRAPPLVAVAILIGLGTVMSAFMNNVGALALLMPVALEVAERNDIPPGRVLMPLAFGSILGGMTTLIGTPPNLIVAGFRESSVGAPFSMFDFAPVGAAVAAAGLILIAVLARFLVPVRSRRGITGFTTGDYLTEARITPDSRLVGTSLGELEQSLAEADALVIGIVRAERRIAAPSRYRELHAGDVLQIRAEPDRLLGLIADFGLELAEAASAKGDGEAAAAGPAADGSAADGSAGGGSAGAPIDAAADRAGAGRERAPPSAELAEVVLLPNSVLAGRSVEDIRLRARFGLNLLAISRYGQDSMTRLKSERLRTGDVLLLQGEAETVSAFASRYGCAPLASRAMRLPARRLALPAILIMAASVAVAALGWLPPATAFLAAVLLFLLLGVVEPRELYQRVDWPVIVLLAALIPVAGTMAATGTADLIARWVLEPAVGVSPAVGVALLLIVTMTLSDFMNNAATAAVMCPIAIGTAARLGVSPDPFLMAVAIGASCAFLTPIGHQNNTLILGPGGFRFGDYWRLGLPVEIVVVAVGVPLILTVWPLVPG